MYESRQSPRFMNMCGSIAVSRRNSPAHVRRNLRTKAFDGPQPPHPAVVIISLFDDEPCGNVLIYPCGTLLRVAMQPPADPIGRKHKSFYPQSIGLRCVALHSPRVIEFSPDCPRSPIKDQLGIGPGVESPSWRNKMSPDTTDYVIAS